MRWSKIQDVDGKPLKRSLILRGDNFLIAHAEYEYEEWGKKLSKLIREKSHRIDKDHFSYRIISHWEKHGLIEAERAEGKGWRKVSLLDSVWIHIISKLREFGFSLEKISLIKESLKNVGRLKDWNLFEFYIGIALGAGEVVYCLAFLDGQAEIVNQSEYVAAMNMGMIDDHIQVSINMILQQIFPGKDLTPRTPNTLTLTSKEVSLIGYLRFGNYDSIRVINKDGDLDMVELEKHEDPSQRIIDLLHKGTFQKIEIVQADGKIQFVNRKKRKKL